MEVNNYEIVMKKGRKEGRKIKIIPALLFLKVILIGSNSIASP